jgi:hypothetical protein
MQNTSSTKAAAAAAALSMQYPNTHIGCQWQMTHCQLTVKSKMNMQAIDAPPHTINLISVHNKSNIEQV